MPIQDVPCGACIGEREPQCSVTTAATIIVTALAVVGAVRGGTGARPGLARDSRQAGVSGCRIRGWELGGALRNQTKSRGGAPLQVAWQCPPGQLRTPLP